MCRCALCPWPSAILLSRVPRSNTTSLSNNCTQILHCLDKQHLSVGCAGVSSVCAQVLSCCQRCPEAVPQACQITVHKYFIVWTNSTCLLDVQVCPLSVPKCYLAVKGAQKQYHKHMRFQEGQDLKTGKVIFEKAEPYVRRNSGFIAFHAALMQSDRPGNPVGLDNAWKYLARSASVAPMHAPRNNC